MNCIGCSFKCRINIHTHIITAVLNLIIYHSFLYVKKIKDKWIRRCRSFELVWKNRWRFIILRRKINLPVPKIRLELFKFSQNQYVVFATHVVTHQIGLNLIIISHFVVFFRAWCWPWRQLVFWRFCQKKRIGTDTAYPVRIILIGGGKGFCLLSTPFRLLTKFPFCRLHLILWSVFEIGFGGATKPSIFTAEIVNWRRLDAP